MGSLRVRLEASLDGPDATSVYECAHCGVESDHWDEDCPVCGGVLMRIVTDDRNDELPTPL